MKVNKKLIVPFLAAVIGLSVSGSIGGAFAWYQYNSQVTASFIGSSVADTSVLQIGHMVSNNIQWERDYVEPNASLIPVTFGALETVSEKANCLPVAKPYGYPEAGKQYNDGYASWSQIDPGKGFSQFDVYLRAVKADGTPVALDVYLSDITIEGVKQTTNSINIVDESLVANAVRIHLNVDNGPNRLIGTQTRDENNKLPLFGNLDLDGDESLDVAGGYTWQTGRDATIVYGVDGQYQTVTGINDIKQTRDGNDLMPAVANEKKICTTKTTDVHGDPEYVKITVTIWLEGWELLKDGKTSTSTSSLWNPAYSAGLDVRVGMTFDTGKVRLNS